MEYLQARIGIQVCDKDFATIIREAIKFDWTRDPFDRIIVAHASLDNSTLISKDSQIIAHYTHAFWA